MRFYATRVAASVCVDIGRLVRGKLPTDQYIRDVTASLRSSDRKARIGPAPFVANSRLLSLPKRRSPIRLRRTN